MAVTQAKGQTLRGRFNMMSLRARSLLSGGSTYHISDTATGQLQDAFLHHHNTHVTATDLPGTALGCHLKASCHPLLLLAREPWRFYQVWSSMNLSSLQLLTRWVCRQAPPADIAKQQVVEHFR